MTNTKDNDIKNILLDIDNTIAQNTQSSMQQEDMRDEARKLLTNPANSTIEETILKSQAPRNSPN